MKFCFYFRIFESEWGLSPFLSLSLPCSPSLSLGQLFQAERILARATGPLPAERFHGSGAVQQGVVWLAWPLPAQERRDGHLPASQPTDPQHPGAGRPAARAGPARSAGPAEAAGGFPVPVLHWAPRRGLLSKGARAQQSLLGLACLASQSHTPTLTAGTAALRPGAKFGWKCGGRQSS